MTFKRSIHNWETLLNSSESTSKNITGKDLLRFQYSLQTYTRRITHAFVPPPASVPSPMQASSETVTTQLPDNSTIDNLPIALRKDKHTCTQLPLFNFVSYSHLSSSFRSFISSLDSCSIFKNMSEALSILGWTQAMQEEMMTL